MQDFVISFADPKPARHSASSKGRGLVSTSFAPVTYTQNFKSQQDVKFEAKLKDMEARDQRAPKRPGTGKPKPQAQQPPAVPQRAAPEEFRITIDAPVPAGAAKRRAARKVPEPLPAAAPAQEAVAESGPPAKKTPAPARRSSEQPPGQRKAADPQKAPARTEAQPAPREAAAPQATATPPTTAAWPASYQQAMPQTVPYLAYPPQYAAPAYPPQCYYVMVPFQAPPK
ncbi:hypothetical protein SS50377_22715 [Spironucleus salmonicida]|uniref:Uncharacterized protein n=1 Tax=Spironucleus salmonicida TaxID=348837 RepID=V6LI30_9EUKA|nr:hypothetical protein SS50377_22708 [Spironucleus salmonicida]KAH0575093.1 hypothetical protein SS50377_22715 [Spironucleus salmonicida]|eukprot:EST44192.1 Hypothetical protein SS50377_15998 [Spironucleus salmonicida]